MELTKITKELLAAGWTKDQTPEEIVKDLCEEYEVEKASAIASVQRFFEKLQAEGILIDE